MSRQNEKNKSYGGDNSTSMISENGLIAMDIEDERKMKIV
tara:strand:+ start:110 stop:229 length:120 start_codon:yes stop_codon:yes gene_type:complete